MSIEALLEAAKYVELTGDPPERPAAPAVTSRGNIDSSGEPEVKESTIVSQSTVNNVYPSKSQKPHNIVQEAVVQHVVRTTVDAEQKNLPSSSGENFIRNTESRQVATVGKNTLRTLDANTPVVKEPSSEIAQDSLLESPNVMRHPGYDVRWSYSPPPPPLPPHHPAASHDEASSAAVYSHPSQKSSFMTAPDNATSRPDNICDTDEGKNLKNGVREVHNKLEKNRRAHLKECFDALKSQIPTLQDRKAKISNSNILSGACRYIGALKRKEKELEHELDRLVRDKIQKQKLLHRLKIETSKSLHLGLSWHREGTVVGQDTSAEVTRPASVTEKGQDRDEEDRYSTSTASEAEEEERKSQQHDPIAVTASSSAVTAVATMTTTVTNSAASSSSSCEITSTSPTTSLPSGSYRHPLKLHLLREHRAQVAREREAAAATSTTDSTQETIGTPIMTTSGSGTSSVTVVPNMPISPSARPTVSQLLGKPSVSIRQPVRKQTPSHSVMHPIQRYQAPGQSFIRAPHRDIAVRPSSTQPVVTIGVTQAMQSRPDLSPQNNKHPHGQVVPVNPQGLKLSHNQMMDNTTNLGHSVSIVSSSLPASFLQAAIPGVSATLTQPLMAPITLSPTPVKQVFLTHQNFTGYASVPSLSPSLLRPFLTNQQTIVNPVLTNITQSSNSSAPISVFSGSLSRSHPTMTLKGPSLPLDSAVRQPLITTGVVTSTFSRNQPVLTPHQVTTVSSVAISRSSAQPQPMIAAMTSAVKAAANKNSKVSGSHRDKPLLTTSQIAQTLLASNVKTVTAGTPAVTSSTSLGKSLLA